MSSLWTQEFEVGGLRYIRAQIVSYHFINLHLINFHLVGLYLIFNLFM